MVVGEGGRFERRWADWDKRIAAGEDASAILGSAKDEELIELLAGESRVDRQYVRDVVATEILNRLYTRSASQHPGAKDVEASAKSAYEAAQDGQEAIHHAEGILKGKGRAKLGAAVSASADASLKATEAAFDSARAQADALHETLAQSRLGGELATEAAQKAEEGRKITHELERTMADIGRAKEGRAASEASRKILQATEDAADDSVEHDAELREATDESK